ncbi:MAG: 30S ribosomal protein S16 [Patescibacteria group bacterium]
MLRIRLTRVGKKNSPAYRVVIADSKRAVKRKFIEIIGHYNPTLNPKEIVIDKERALFWIGNGAQPSDTVNNLMCDLGILNKKDKVNKVFGKKFSKKDIKEGKDKEPETPAAVEEKTETKEVEEAPVETVEEVTAEEETPEKEEAAEATAEEAKSE